MKSGGMLSPADPTFWQKGESFRALKQKLMVSERRWVKDGDVLRDQQLSEMARCSAAQSAL